MNVQAVLPGMGANTAMKQTVAQLRSGRELAIAQRRNIELKFLGTNQIQLVRYDVPNGTTVLSTITLEGKNEFRLIWRYSGYSRWVRERIRSLFQRAGLLDVFKQWNSGRFRHQSRQWIDFSRTGINIPTQQGLSPFSAPPAGFEITNGSEMHGFTNSMKGHMRPVGRLSQDNSGFSLVEALMAAVILAGGLLALAYGLSQGMVIASTSHYHQIAKEKASEATRERQYLQRYPHYRLDSNPECR